MRDGLVSMREMFERKTRLDRDNIPALERRIVSNEGKLQGINAKGEAAKPGEAEKLESAISNVSTVRSAFDRTLDIAMAWANAVAFGRINNPSSNSTRAACSSKNACGTRSCSSIRASSWCRDCIRTGRPRGSSMRSLGRRIGGGWSRRSRECLRENRAV